MLVQAKDLGMRVRDLLDNETVKCDLEALDKEECFEELIELLVRAGRITDRAAALSAIHEREVQGTTGIGKGVAVPHGKHSSIPKLTAACGLSREGIEFDSIDGQPVHLVILLLANTGEPGPHVQALAEISRVVAIPGFYRRATQVSDVAEFLSVLDVEE